MAILQVYLQTINKYKLNNKQAKLSTEGKTSSPVKDSLQLYQLYII